MKEKKVKGLRKVLLIGTACVLVAGISVAATLAYLTASTNVKDNVFQASPGITGEIQEPAYDLTANHKVLPGVRDDKDPLVHNTTEDASIIVGMKLTFYIDVDGTKQKVSYDTFKKFVNIQYDTSSNDNFNSINYADENSFDATDKWVKVTTGSDSDCLYFIYDRILDEKDNTNVYAEKNNTTGVITGKYTDTTGYGDNTLPIFKYVTPSANIYIGNKNANNNGKTVGTHSNLSAGPSGKVYDHFNYYIKIDSYGVKNDDSITNTPGSTDSTKIDTAMSTIVTGLNAM